MRRMILCCLLLAGSLPATARAALVGHWTFDAASGSLAADASGQGHDATLLGSPTWSPGTGIAGGALSFVGSGDRASVTDSAALDPGASFSLAAWLAPSLQATQYPIIKASYGISDGYELSLASNGRVFARLNQTTAGNQYRVDSTSTYPTSGSSWLHAGVVFDGAELRLYIDGVLEASVPAPGLVIAPNGDPLTFGSDSGGGSPYRGSLDEVYLYDHALSQAELHALPGVADAYANATAAPGGSGGAGSAGSSSESRSLYVKQGSNCYGPWPTCGTQANPFDDIDQCASELVAGETCYVMDGFYYKGIDLGEASPYEPARSGTADQPIAFRAYPGDRPTISNADNVTWNFGMRNRRDYIVYDGFRIEGVLRIKGDSEDSRSVGVIVENCEIWQGGGKDDGNWSGIFAEFVQDLTVRNNFIRSMRSPSGGSAKGMSIFNGRRTIVENNLFYDNPSEGVFDKEGGQDNVYRRNVLWNNNIGLKINNQSDSYGVANERTQIYENIFVCTADTDEAIRMLVEPTDWAIYNNTGYECSAIVVRSGSGPADGGVVYNNIWWSSESGKKMWESQNGDDREPDLLDFNLYAPNGNYRENRYTSDDESYDSLTSWRSVAHPVLYDGNSQEGDPLFVDPLNGDFRLGPGSPAIGAGMLGEDLGAWPRADDTPIGPTSALFDCIPGALGDCSAATSPAPDPSDLAEPCGGDCGSSSIPALPVPLLALAVAGLAVAEAGHARRRERG